MSICSILANDDNLCGESPLWDASDQRLYWTDNAGSKFYRYDWTSKRHDLLLENFEVNGCALDHSGDLTFINNSGVWLWNKKDKPKLIVAEVEGEKLQLNDCIADPQGRLLAGSCFYNPTSEYPLGKLFCIRPDGTAEILDEGFHLANGLGFSPDCRNLYFSDSIARLIYKYDYDSTTGRVRNRKIFVRLDRSSGLPDGLTVDAAGFVWSAEWYGSCICRYDPDGKLERKISIPAKQTSSPAFGGPELKDIFITSAARSEPMPIMPPGYDANSGYFGGALFHINLGIAGMVEYRTRFKNNC